MDAGWNDPLVVAREALIRAGVLETMAMDGMDGASQKPAGRYCLRTGRRQPPLNTRHSWHF